MSTWYEYIQRDAPIPKQPYPVDYDKERTFETDIMVLGGGVAGICRATQFFCSEYKTELIFNIGLDILRETEEKRVLKLYALDPHKLVHSLQDLRILTDALLVLHASLARKASSQPLDFHRIDYPELDPPEWAKFITIKLENDKVKIGEKSLDQACNLKEQYEAHNKDYTGQHIKDLSF